MDDLLQFVPEDKRDEFKQAASNYVKADEENLIKAVKERQAVFDKIVAGPMDKRLENWKAQELPKVIEQERERIRKELHPEMTPEQKELAELKQKFAEKEAKERLFERKSELRQKYKDADQDIADRIAALDDETVDAVMAKVAEYKAKIDELEKKGKYGSTPPKGGSGQSPDFSKMTLDQATEYAKRGDMEKQAFLEWQRNRR